MMKQVFLVITTLLFISTTLLISQNLVLRGGTVLTVTNGVIQDGTVIIKNGKITDVGKDIPIPEGFKVIDATNKYIMPGLIDTHVHYALPGMGDVNEVSSPVTPHVDMRDILVPGDDAIRKVLAGGITTVKTMHGSANVIGGMNVTIKMKYNTTPEEMIIPGVRQQIKMALGENPKNLYGKRKQIPSTRMGNAWILKKAFSDAEEYKKKWDKYRKGKKKKRGKVPSKDMKLEVLSKVLTGEYSIDCHIYRGDEIEWFIRFCKERNLILKQISHCIDGYKVADVMADYDVSYGGWIDNWGFKEEAYDGCPWGIKIMHDAGVNIVINSDAVSAGSSRYLFLEAGRILRYNDIPDNEILKMITINAAKTLDLENRIGSIEKGKDGDLAVFDKHPLDSTTKCVMTIIEGKVWFDYDRRTNRSL